MEGTVYIFHGLFDRSELINISPLKLVLSRMGYDVKVPEFIGHGKRKNAEMLCVKKKQMLILDRITGNGTTDHLALFNYFPTIKFIKETIAT